MTHAEAVATMREANAEILELGAAIKELLDIAVSAPESVDESKLVATSRMVADAYKVFFASFAASAMRLEELHNMKEN